MSVILESYLFKKSVQHLNSLNKPLIKYHQILSHSKNNDSIIKLLPVLPERVS